MDPVDKYEHMRRYDDLMGRYQWLQLICFFMGLVIVFLAQAAFG